jgi:hypothetical protein
MHSKKPQWDFTMYVKWERLRLEAQSGAREFSLVSVLVADNPNQGKGNPQEKVIEHLGDIKEKFLTTKARDMRAFHQGLFWVAVDKKLEHLKLEPEVRKKIEAEISETVPRPGEDWALWSVTCIPRYDP